VQPRPRAAGRLELSAGTTADDIRVADPLAGLAWLDVG